MQIYKNLSGNSGVDTYEIGSDFIKVKFKTTSRAGFNAYTYSYKSAGSVHIDNMKKLADAGAGLNSYIMREVRNAFELKEYIKA